MEEGNKVRQIAPVIEGTIVDTEYDKSTKALRHLVEYTDAEGDEHQRWFSESELELVEEKGGK